MAHDPRPRATGRPITVDERRIVERLLLPLGEAAAPYRAQLADARVAPACSCGCPSVKFLPDPQGVGVATQIADATATSPEGHAIGVLLFARDGRLVELEFYASSDVGEFRVPAPEAVHEWGEKSG
jgi:hypothetical protein